MTKEKAKVRAEIIEMCPEIMELTEGCRIKIWWMDDPSAHEADETTIKNIIQNNTWKI